MKIDASALIYLAKIDFLAQVTDKYQPIKITQSIYDEVVTQGKKKGFSDAFIIDNFIDKGKITIEKDDAEFPSNLANLDVGEISAIVSVLKTKELLIIDDIKARNRAKDLEVDFLGTDGLLLDSFISNYIDYDFFEKKIYFLANLLLLKSSKVMKLLKQAKNLKKRKKE
ncbi:MAG: hypothetical protein HeimC3_51330 [Candidatus Heimdallarchaeota archaeon LC_3]|nr:MAG: hypothetical protein HeimC3_51330 [Candidatus Heimdallarchaeota archaeon LC_3]